MAVRRQCNRYRTEPFGRDFEEVLKRAKRFFRDETFMIYSTQTKDITVWHTDTPSIAFKNPTNAIYYTKHGKRWAREN